MADFRIGAHTIRPSLGRIVANGSEVHVERRAMEVLVVLASRPGDTVSRDELIAAVWKHPHVTDEALSRCVSLLRQVLGDDGSRPRMIETIPKRGYRLATTVEVVGQPSDIVVPDWRKTNLTLPLTRIIGRETELVEIRALLAAHRLVTLTGSGGVGKTRLAIEAGRQALADLADGAWLVELAPVSDPTVIPLAVATALGIELGHSTAPLRKLAQQIGERALLLILDNCEHLIDAAGALAEALLGTAPRLRVLATSRTPLAISGEELYRVPSLAVPPDNRTALDEIMSAASVQLFTERAKAADWHFGVEHENAVAMADICRRLDGIPLAIEMAAARAPVLGVVQLARVLDQRFRILTEGKRTALQRQQTLRATLDWSYSLLAEPERALLARLAVFAGGFTLEAVTAVAADGVIDKVEVPGLLTRLIAHSLVVAETNLDGARYRLLETTHAYLMERLDEATDGDDVHARHLDFYLRLAEDAEPRLRSVEQSQLMARLDRERENFLAAHAWGDRNAVAASLDLRLVLALKGYWIHRGGLELGLRMTREALARAGAQKRDLVRCRALHAAAHLTSCLSGRFEGDGLSEALSIAREVGDEATLSLMLLWTGGQFLLEGKPAETRKLADEAVRIARRPNGRKMLLPALQVLIEVDRLEGDLNAAERHARESLAVARGRNQPVDRGVAFLNLAAVTIDLATTRGVPEMLVEALAICIEVGSKPLGANGLMVCAGLAASFGEWRRAVEWHAAARHANQETGWAPEAADEAFVTRVMKRAREALSASELSAADTAGKAVSYEQAMTDARCWLEQLAASERGPTTRPSPPPSDPRS